jgi:hypothetical protein
MTGQQVALAIDQAGLEPAFPQCPAAAMNSVDYADKPSSNVLQHPGNGAGLVRRRQEVDVIAHQDISMDGAIPAEGRFMQALQVEPAIHLAKEASGTVVPPLDDVKRSTGEL